VEHKVQRYALVLQLRQRFTPLAKRNHATSGFTYWIDFCGRYNKTVTSGTLPTGTLYNNILRHTAPCTAATISGTVTRNLASTIVLTSGTQSPTVCSGTAITTTVYTFGGATDATVVVYLLD
jgi:hypothetical protein